MKLTEVAALLVKMAAFDQRTIGDADVAAWAEALGDSVALKDGLDAITAHYRASNDRMMPADLIRVVGGVRRDRLRRAGDPPIPGDLNHTQEKAWRHLWCAAVKDGADSTAAAAHADQAMGLASSLPPPDPTRLAELRRWVRDALPEPSVAP